MKFSADIYESWREKQREKYEELFPKLKSHLKKGFALLDIGIGRAWFEDFLNDRKVGFKEIIGVDVDEIMTLPQKKGITYFITDDFVTAREFDFVVCFDTLHLLSEPRKLLRYSKNLVLVSLPMAFKEKLEVFRDQKIIEEGEIGNQEKDYFILIKV